MMKTYFMQNVFTEYPAVPWKQGWRFLAGPDDPCPLLTGDAQGELTAKNCAWTLHLLDPTIPLTVRLLSNGLSLYVRKQEKEKHIEALLLEPGILIGSVQGLPPPALNSTEQTNQDPGFTWIKAAPCNALLICKGSRFVLVTGTLPRELALLKAEEALEENFNALREEETKKRLSTAGLFSINPRHNPPVALAAESLRLRLRGRNAALPGIWSASDMPGPETFSLNELYPLVQAWRLIHPKTALNLVHTALALQQSSGGFPAWVNCEGAASAAAPWPFVIQAFELALQDQHDPVLLKKTLPALRKYMQWALRRFDPHRDLIPAWQSDQEVFIPESFERGKASPDLTVMLLGELEALLRLCDESDHSEAAIGPLTAEHDQLAQTLTTVFWNPETKAFSNVWKEGHYIHEPSFGSFLPLYWSGLPAEFKKPLLENFEETHGFPGRADPASWKQEQIDDTVHLPAIHQFMAFETLRRGDESRALLMLFVRRAREGFAAWFERESIEAARLQRHNAHIEKSAYALGPVTASLLLTTQYEFQHEALTHAPTLKNLQRLIHRMRLTRSDLRIILVVGLAMLVVHLLYHPPTHINENARMAEAALNYRQGQFSEAMKICRRYPDNALSRFLQGNLMTLTGNPESAEQLYYQALLEKTESPSALFGYALSLQLNGKFDEAIQRYNDFLDIHEAQLSGGPNDALIELAYEFMRLADAEFRIPPKWKRVYTLPVMNDLGL
ncbi:MAG: hypothetical protein ISR85_06790 [Kiritimatiellales bacterium]|nr:hypothetical protein [Kiritimatiellota bacterium]MBL7012617.1 hypothetical protein [Kiritimatiellales bacterium]